MESLVLLSGGLDSAVLLAHEAESARVHPVYVSVGLAWEHAERHMVGRLLAELAGNGRIAPLATLDLTMRDVYAPAHWAIRGTPPAYDTPDEDVYLLGRNVVLLTKAAVLAASRRIPRIALGTLADNPFPDASPAFFSAIGHALSLGLDHELHVVTPLASMHKPDVIRRGAALGVPLALTLSCMNPVDDGADPPDEGANSGDDGTDRVDDPLPRHCGLCSKCRERRDAFAAAGIPDPARYAHVSPR